MIARLAPTHRKKLAGSSRGHRNPSKLQCPRQLRIGARREFLRAGKQELVRHHTAMFQTVTVNHLEVRYRYFDAVRQIGTKRAALGERKLPGLHDSSCRAIANDRTALFQLDYAGEQFR